MPKVDYILRHKYRIFTEQRCKVLKKEENSWKLYNDYKVVIPVDAPVHNQDPFVFHTPWIHAYCHINSLKKTAGEQSILTWGCWGDGYRQNQFLIDTVFIINRKFSWCEDEPSSEFKRNNPYTRQDSLYQDLLRYRCDKPNSDRIYDAKHYNNTMKIQQEKREEDFYSFIPLKIENGCYALIDISSVINERHPEFNDKMSSSDGKANGIRNIDYALYVIKYLQQNADILVLEVLDKKFNSTFESVRDSVFNSQYDGLVDRELQKRYYPIIYGVEYTKEIENNLLKVYCSSNNDSEDND